MATHGEPIAELSPATDVRIRRILAAAKTRAALVRVLRRHFTTADLKILFDAIPDGSSPPVSTLAEALGTAWTESANADRRAADRAEG